MREAIREAGIVRVSLSAKEVTLVCVARSSAVGLAASAAVAVALS